MIKRIKYKLLKRKSKYRPKHKLHWVEVKHLLENVQVFAQGNPNHWESLKTIIQNHNKFRICIINEESMWDFIDTFNNIKNRYGDAWADATYLPVLKKTVMQIQRKVKHDMKISNIELYEKYKLLLND